MSIFDKNESDDLNAILNWKMDDGIGYIDKFKDRQVAADFNNIGKSFLANSIISLFEILKNKNFLNGADTLIFPIMFNVWHSFELLLKSGTLALDIIKNPETLGSNKLIKGHKLFGDEKSLINIFLEKLRCLELSECENKYLKTVKNILEDFKSKDMRFDSARYSYDLNLNSQFYNKTDSHDRIIENTYINIPKLLAKLLNLIGDFIPLINELNYQLTNIQKKSSIKITDKIIIENIDYSKMKAVEFDEILGVLEKTNYESIIMELL